MPDYLVTIDYNLESDPEGSPRRTFTHKIPNQIGYYEAEHAAIDALLTELEITISGIKEDMHVATKNTRSPEGSVIKYL